MHPYVYFPRSIFAAFAKSKRQSLILSAINLPLIYFCSSLFFDYFYAVFFCETFKPISNSWQFSILPKMCCNIFIFYYYFYTLPHRCSKGYYGYVYLFVMPQRRRYRDLLLTIPIDLEKLFDSIYACPSFCLSMYFFGYQSTVRKY